MKENKNISKGIIPTDHIMTHLEVERAAINIREVERRLEDKRTGKTDIGEWLILSPAIIIVLIAIISSFFS